MRFHSLDGLRGIFLILMMHSHMQAVVNSWLGKISHHDISLADASNGFVFLSGLMAGFIYTGRMIRVGTDGMTRIVLTRVRTLYLYHATLIFVLLLMSGIALGLSLEVRQLHPFMSDPLRSKLVALSLSADLSYMDILPMYMMFLAGTPLVLRLFRRGYVVQVMVASILLWLLAQTGLSEFLTSRAERFLGLKKVRWSLASTST
ncbi:OpgC domain-containing protein [Rubellimicrobium arenae]|uniref:OpgC domain-containing protein n=1 Tax=Rubellimicrobium arenae TaxID=2817372 RepID=UPI001B307DBF|nr:OpgC domain-containing protein [Rubellimicrobium arenae]